MCVCSCECSCECVFVCLCVCVVQLVLYLTHMEGVCLTSLWEGEQMGRGG